MLLKTSELNQAINLINTISFVRYAEHNKVNEQIRVAIDKTKVGDPMQLLRAIAELNEDVYYNINYTKSYELETSIMVCFDYN